MMTPIYIKIGMSILRHLVSAIGGYLIGKGIIDEASWQEIMGAVLALAAAIAGGFDKKRTEVEVQEVKQNFTAEKPKPPTKTAKKK